MIAVSGFPRCFSVRNRKERYPDGSFSIGRRSPGPFMVRRKKMFCQNCGKELPEGSKFCQSCGAPVEGTASAQGPAAPVSSGPDFSGFRHQYEHTFYIVAVVINIITALVMFITLVGIPYLISIVTTLIVAFFINYAQQMSYSVKVTEKNFPEIYRKSVEFAGKLGLEKVPEVYVTQKNGALNAFASWCFGRRYVQLNAELVDIAYMENKDFDTVWFVMAHEFAHIYYDHVSLKYNISIFFAKLFPVIGPALSRAREYSCDKLARHLTEDKNAADCIAMLTAGRHLYKYVDASDYLQNTSSDGYSSLEVFFRFMINLCADHPITPYRMDAATGPMEKQGRLF